jgi:hypothetical protein
MPYRYLDLNGLKPTPDEYRQILTERLKTLDQCARDPLGGDPYPIAWRQGFKAYWRPLKRDRDGNLLVLLWATGPGLHPRYERRVRLVQRKHFPSSLALE